MNPFSYQRASDPAMAIQAIADNSRAKLLGGGTNLIDLMKDDVEHPSTLVDITRLAGLATIAQVDRGLMVGALARNSDLANEPDVRTHYPLLSQALLSGASTQLRNLATTGGNLLQRTRCYYFMDPTYAACNKRAPGTGCSAVQGFNRIHAILGQTDHGPTDKSTCIATNPSDMSVAMAALQAIVQIDGVKGKHTMPVREFHRLVGTTPQLDTNLQRNELITGVLLPREAADFAAHSYYLKARDRQSYAFANVSVAAGLRMQGSLITGVAFAMGGVCHKPWTSTEAERLMIGKPATADTFQQAAAVTLKGAKGYENNSFKIELARNCIVRAFTLASQGTGTASA